ncbi:MAG: PP2C family protein-serine/threonine phosphatase, partial [Polyangiales bacterium]
MSGDAHRNGDGPPKTGQGEETLIPAPGTELGIRTSMAANRAPAPKGIGVTLYGKTHVGLVREHNEDNFMVGDLEAADGPRPGGEVVKSSVSERGIALAVCDGMGGAAAGEVASQMAVNTLFETLRGDGAPEDRDSFASRLVDSIEEAGARI